MINNPDKQSESANQSPFIHERIKPRTCPPSGAQVKVMKTIQSDLQPSFNSLTLDDEDDVDVADEEVNWFCYEKLYPFKVEQKTFPCEYSFRSVICSYLTAPNVGCN